MMPIESRLSNTQKEFVENTIMLSESDFVIADSKNAPQVMLCNQVHALMNGLQTQTNTGEFALLSKIYHEPGLIHGISKVGPKITMGDVRLYILDIADVIIAKAAHDNQICMDTCHWDCNQLKQQAKQKSDHDTALGQKANMDQGDQGSRSRGYHNDVQRSFLSFMAGGLTSGVMYPLNSSDINQPTQRPTRHTSQHQAARSVIDRFEQNHNNRSLIAALNRIDGITQAFK